jgi:three-Cys-motif partner protein
MFGTSMKNKWKELHYIDLFAGSGITKLKDKEKLGWGSPLIAAQNPKKVINKLHLCEKNKEKYHALKTRIKSIENPPEIQIFNADGNKKAKKIIDDIPRDSLCLSFLDPYGLHLNFETIKILSQRRGDLIIFYPDKLDILRNWHEYYYDNPKSNLDLFLGADSNWREVLSNTASANYVDKFANIYQNQLHKIGYNYTSKERIPAKGRELYLLIFASKSKFALKLWTENVSIKANGQRTFPKFN